MDQPDYPEAVEAVKELTTGLVGDMQPQGIGFDAAKAKRIRDMESAIDQIRLGGAARAGGIRVLGASEFDIRDAAMGHATQFEGANIKQTVEKAQIIEHYLRFGDYKTPPTADEGWPVAGSSVETQEAPMEGKGG